MVVFATGVHAAQTVPAYRGADGRARSRNVVAPSGVVDTAPNQFQRARLENLTRDRAAIGDDTLRVVAFQVQFTDTLMGAQHDATWFTNELIHAEQYFRGASRGRLTLAWTLVDSLYTLPHTMNYYGADSKEETRVVELTQDVVDMADASVDFSQYDNVFIIHAGAGQETDVNGDSPNQLWSSFYDRGDIRKAQDDDISGGIPTNDVSGGDPFFVDNFAIVPARASQDFITIGTLGIWAYELGSRLGLLPLFDSTPDGAPDSQGVGNFCLMAYGIFNVNGFVPAFPCAFNRILAGWLDPVVIDAGSTATDVRLTDVNTGSDTDTLCVKIPITDSEYYLVTNRVHDANFDSLFTFGDVDSNLIPGNTESLDGAEFDFFLTDLTNPGVRRPDPRYPDQGDVLFRHTGSGVYVWHVDERVVTDAAQHGYLPDDYPARKGVDLEEADGVQDMDRVGPAAFALGSYFDSYRTGENNNTIFGPDTKPASRSNAGAPSGIVIETLSGPGFHMRVSIGRETSYDEARTRWGASARNQPATVVNWDNAGAPEIVTLGDDAGVFVFDETGHEKPDPDADPSTIAPFVPVAGVKWSGPPAFANLDGASDIELVASSVGGIVYAWKSNGTELVDGDANAGTTGVLFVGQPAAAPPLLIDIGDGGEPEVAIAEHDASSIRIRFVSATGAAVIPPAAATLWPATVSAQFLAPLAVASVSGATSTMGIVACGVDSTASRVVVQWTPFNAVVSSWSQAIAVPSGWKAESFLPSAPAVGDLDHDGDDEVVVATPDGNVFVFDFSSGSVIRETGTLAARHPSAPALGDVDNDGTLEIAIWDAEYMYLLKSNARPMLEWPRAIRPESAGEAPSVTPRREMESAVIADFDGDSKVDVVFPLDDGTLAAFTPRAASLAGFPRTGPAEAGAAPSFAELAPGASSLVILGAYAGLDGVDTVLDTLASTPSSSLSIQSLGPSGTGAPFWPMARVDLARTGRVSLTSALVTIARTFDEESFIIYPNPVKESVVHARVTTHTQAHVRVSIYTLEGLNATTHEFDVNPSGVTDTPFDEAIDVSRLKSGVYFMRLEIEGLGGSGAVYKPFAIRR
jgi:M6 family metalloprotease-like protein